MPSWFTWAVRGGLLALAAAWLIGIAALRPASLAGDPYAVYYPIAQNLADGDGLRSFGPLMIGSGRQPGYPVLLALARPFTRDMVQAGQLVGITSALFALGALMWILGRRGAPLGIVAASVLLVASGNTFVRAALESAPDMAFLATFALLVALLVIAHERAAPRLGLLLAAGVVAGLGALIRPNGIALLPGGILAVVSLSSELRSRRAVSYALGFVLGVLPILLVIWGLREDGLVYPRDDVRSVVFVPKPGQSELAAFLEPLWSGVRNIPWRLSRVVTYPFALLGSAALVLAALRDPRPEARIVFWLSAALIGILVPLHFEHRYYLFMVPSLFVAGLLALPWLGRRLALRPSVPWAVVVVSTAVITAGFANKSIAEAEREIAIDREFQALCDRALEGAPDDAWVLTGIPGDFYAYSRFRECPTPGWRPPRLLLVPASSEDVGLARWMGIGGRPPPAAGTLLEQRAGFELFAVPEQLRAVASNGEAAELEGLPWRLALPGPPGDCRRGSLGAAPGLAEVELVGRSDPPLVARVEVSSGGVARTAWTAGERGEPLRFDLEVGPDGRVEVSLCAADPLRSAGRVALESLRVAPRGQ